MYYLLSSNKGGLAVFQDSYDDARIDTAIKFYIELRSHNDLYSAWNTEVISLIHVPKDNILGISEDLEELKTQALFEAL